MTFTVSPRPLPLLVALVLTLGLLAPAVATPAATLHAPGPGVLQGGASRHPIPGDTPVITVSSPLTPCSWIAASNGIGADTNANYWAMGFRTDHTIAFTITGDFPADRYTSFQVYTNSLTVFGDRIDVNFPVASGSRNPVVNGLSPLTSGPYTYAFTQTDAFPAAHVPDGSAVALLYRVYLPDNGADMYGNAGLPTVTPYESSTGAPVNCPVTSPVLGPSPSAILPSYVQFYHWPIGQYPNMDNAYLAATLPSSTTLYMLHFLPPTTPHTLGGEPIDLSTQLRYWSICLYQGRIIAPECYADENVPTQNGQVVVALGPANMQPSNATPANGVLWIPFATNVTEAETPSVAIRNMLPNASFSNSAFSVPLGAAAGATNMGAYAPSIVVCSQQDFQANECLPPTPTPTSPLPPPPAPTSPPTQPTPTGTPVPANTPPPAPTQPVQAPVAPTPTATAVTNGCATRAAPPLDVQIAPRRLYSGDTLNVSISTAARAHADLTLQVTTTKTVVTGKGKHRKHIKKTVVLYSVVHHLTASSHGRISDHIHVTYQPGASVQATVQVRTRTSCASVTHHNTLTITPLFTTHLATRSVSRGGTLRVNIQSLARASVTLTLQVTATKTVVTGKGKHRKHVKKTVVLYRVSSSGTAGKKGSFDGRLHVTYTTHKSVRASLTISVHAGHHALSEQTSVTIQPPPGHKHKH